MSERRPLTSDADCTKCSGTGIRVVKELAPGVSSMHLKCGGGPAPQVTRRNLCDCVQAGYRP